MSADSIPVPSVFSFRMVAQEVCCVPPCTPLDTVYSSFMGRSIKRVPIVRYYGTTPAGQKCCLHLHGTFPYFFLRYDDDLPMSVTAVDSYCRSLALSIERAYCLKHNRRSAQVVHHIGGVRGTPFYGFCADDVLFLKVSLYDAKHMSSVVSLLRCGAVMERSFQPYESHIPYALQVALDYNLYGMDRMHVDRVRFRAPLAPAPATMRWGKRELYAHPVGSLEAHERVQHVLLLRTWFDGLHEATVQWSPLPRWSTCALEVDVEATSIVNVRTLLRFGEDDLDVPSVSSSGPSLQAPSTQRLPSPSIRKWVLPSLALIWEDERARRRVLRMCMTDLDEADDDEESTTAAGPSPTASQQALRAQAMLWGTASQRVRARMQDLIDLECDVEALMAQLPGAGGTQAASPDSGVTGSSQGAVADSSQVSLSELSLMASNVRWEEVERGQREQREREVEDEADLRALEALVMGNSAKAGISGSDSDGDDADAEEDGSEHRSGTARVPVIVNVERASQAVVDSEEDDLIAALKWMRQLDNDVHWSDDEEEEDGGSGGDGVRARGSGSHGSSGPTGEETAATLTREMLGSQEIHDIENCPGSMEEWSASFLHDSSMTADANAIPQSTDSDLLDAAGARVSSSISTAVSRTTDTLATQTTTSEMNVSRDGRGGDDEEASWMEQPTSGGDNVDDGGDGDDADGDGDGDDVHVSIDEGHRTNGNGSGPGVDVGSGHVLSSPLSSPRASPGGRRTAARASVPILRSVLKSPMSPGWGHSSRKRVRFAPFASVIHTNDASGEGAPMFEPGEPSPIKRDAHMRRRVTFLDDVEEVMETPPSDAFVDPCTRPHQRHKLVHGDHDDEVGGGGSGGGGVGMGNMGVDEHRMDAMNDDDNDDEGKDNDDVDDVPTQPSVGVQSPSASPSRSPLRASASPVTCPRLVLRRDPPSVSQVYTDLTSRGLPRVVYVEPYYSDAKDVPPHRRRVVYGGREFRFEPHNDVTHLPPWPNSSHALDRDRKRPTLRIVTPLRLPPTARDCLREVRRASGAGAAQHRGQAVMSQLETVSQPDFAWKVASPRTPVGAVAPLHQGGSCVPSSARPSSSVDGGGGGGVGGGVARVLDMSCEVTSSSPTQRLETTQLAATAVDPGGADALLMPSSSARLPSSSTPTPGFSASSTPHDGQAAVATTRTTTAAAAAALRSTQVVRLAQENARSLHLTWIAIEVHAASREHLRPDPVHDPIVFIAWAAHSSHARWCEHSAYRRLSGVILVVPGDPSCDVEAAALRRELCRWGSRAHTEAEGSVDVVTVSNEVEALRELSHVMHRVDADIVMGWEVQMGSLGYLMDRGMELGVNVCAALSRSASGLNAFAPDDGERGNWDWKRVGSDCRIAGRIVMNVWRIMRTEVKLNAYAYDNVVWHVLHKRRPMYASQDVTRMWNGDMSGAASHQQQLQRQQQQHPKGAPLRSCARQRHRVLSFYLTRAHDCISMLQKCNVVTRTATLARCFGIDFFSVLSRGSQYRVESMMLRLTKPFNYILISPSRKQVINQRAPECIPLVMEPRSALYTSPVVVLDFQSLYPSIVIAYNICYSTCLGKVPDTIPDSLEWQALEASGLYRKPLGVTELHLKPGLMSLFRDQEPNVLPNRTMFAPKSIRRGLLPRMLSELLSTRRMVKRSMKAHNMDDTALHQLLDARQLGLKMIANVTYGYTSANFSGRMPCVDIADAIVSTARQTLENAIRLVEGNKEWGAEVVYGDTDSLFVHLPGRSRADAFRIGRLIAEAVTRANPTPVRLQFEKVYHPCALVSKKRYVGHMWESPAQLKPSYDAKGIETVRRDTCPAVAKIMRNVLEQLFTHRDLSSIKAYVQSQCAKIQLNRVSLGDFVFAKEVRLGTYSTKVTAPPAALVASYAIARDPRAQPAYGERVPYVVVQGPPGARLSDQVMHPHRMLLGQGGAPLILHSTYYITKQVLPSLARILQLVGADPALWFAQMPRQSRARAPVSRARALPVQGPVRHATIDQYYLSQHCPVCDALTDKGVCLECRKQPQATHFILTRRRRRLERQLEHQRRICRACEAVSPADGEASLCRSLWCPMFYERNKLKAQLRAEGAVTGLALKKQGGK